MKDDMVPGRRAVKILLVAAIIIASIFMVNQLHGALYKPPPAIRFAVYKAHYNSTEGSVTAWLDQNGTLPAYNVRVFLDWGTEWRFQRVNPEEFIRIRFEKTLGASDLPYWEELYMEWEYPNDGGGMKHDDRVLFIVLTRNDVVT